MIYVVLKTTPRGDKKFCASNHAQARHTTKYDAERTQKRMAERGIDTELLAFKNLAEAAKYAASFSTYA